MSVKNVLSSGYKDKGLGTPEAEYSELGPFHCEDCILQKPSKNGKGLCREKHVLRDAKNGKIKLDPKSGLAIIDLEHGCCRFVKPPKNNDRPK